MQNWTLQVPLIVGGAALVAMGVHRLAGGWFGTMPSVVAIAVTVAGTGVLLFGTFLGRWQPAAPLPRVELDPRSPDTTGEPAPVTDVTGVVRRVGGDAVRGATVVLVSPDEEDVLVRSESETAADGTFSFSGVQIGGPYMVETTFDGARFSSPGFLVPTGPAELLVAPTTTEPDGLVVRAASLAVVGDERGLQAVQAVTLDNRGDRAFAGSLRLPLLPGAVAIQPTMGISRPRLSVEEGALVSRAPVLPGQTQITYTYAATATRSALELETRLDYPTERFDLLLGGRLHASGSDPQANPDTVEVGERTYQRLSWTDLDAGGVVRARVSERARSPVPPAAGIAAAAAAAAAIVGWPLVRRRRRGAA